MKVSMKTSYTTGVVGDFLDVHPSHIYEEEYVNDRIDLGNF
jgi:hypothetical protein